MQQEDELTGLRAELDQRNAELAVISSIQAGIAAELDFQAGQGLDDGRVRRPVTVTVRHGPPTFRASMSGSSHKGAST